MIEEDIKKVIHQNFLLILLTMLDIRIKLSCFKTQGTKLTQIKNVGQD